MQYFDYILLIVILLSLNIKSETVLPKTSFDRSWINNEFCTKGYYKSKNYYKTIPQYWLYFSNVTNNYYAYNFEGSDVNMTLWNFRLALVSNKFNIVSSNKFVVFSEKWFEGLDLKHKVLFQNSSCTWYEDKENVYPILCGTAYKIIYCPNFRGGFNWQVTYENPFIIKLILNRETQKVTSYKIVEYPYSIKDLYKDATYSIKNWYENAIYIPVPAPLSCTNYMLVANHKNGVEESGDVIPPDIELIGILDNGKVFMQEPLLKKKNISLRWLSRLKCFSNNTYFFCYRDLNMNPSIFDKRKIIKVGNISFINVNVELPDNYINKNVCFYKNNVVLAGSINEIATVITLKYTKDKTIRKIYKLPKVKFEKYDRLMTILRPDHCVDIVLSKNQIEEDIERKLPIIYTINLNEKINK